MKHRQQASRKRAGSTDRQDQAPESSQTSQHQPDEIVPAVQRRGSCRSFCVRFTTSWAMVLSTFALVYFGRQPMMSLLIFILQFLVYRELVLVSIRHDEEQKMPSFKFFYYYWGICFAFFCYVGVLRHGLATGVPMLDWVVDNYLLISFAVWIFGFVLFVLSLEKESLRYQLARFAYCHVAGFGVAGTSAVMCYNMRHGMIWFVIPQGAVVACDVFSYIFGFLFGRTPLIALSPKKTWEGFIGGGISTLIWAVWFTNLMETTQGAFWNQVMVCPGANDGSLGFTFPECDVAARHGGMHMAKPFRSFTVGSIVDWGIPLVGDLEVSEMQLHALSIAMFASVVAPFGGYFASALKRSLQLKDFGSMVVGHGGVTDRMDCQLIHCVFVFIYLSFFANLDPLPTDAHALVQAVRNLPPEYAQALCNGT